MSCNTPGMLSLFYYIKIAMNIIFIAAPILLLILGTIDFLKVVTSGDEKGMRKATDDFIKRIIICVVILLLPLLINFVMSMLNVKSYKECFVNATKANIEKLDKEYAKKQEEEAKKLEEELHKQTNSSTNNDSGNSNVQGTPLNVESGYHEFYYGNLRYYVCFPPNATTNLPILLWLHGDNFREEWVRSSICTTAYSNGYPALIVMPFVGRTMGHQVKGWYEGGLLPTVKALTDEVCDRYQCNRNNINIGGHSRGAIGTWMMVSQYPNYFHAAAPVSCCSFYGMNASSFSGMKVWAYRGSNAGNGDNNDNIYAGCMQSDINAVSKYAREVRYTILPNTTHGDATNELQRSAEFVKFMFGN